MTIILRLVWMQEVQRASRTMGTILVQIHLAGSSSGLKPTGLAFDVKSVDMMFTHLGCWLPMQSKGYDSTNYLQDQLGFSRIHRHKCSEVSPEFDAGTIF